MSLHDINRLVRQAFLAEAHELRTQVRALVELGSDDELGALPNLMDRLTSASAMAGFMAFSRFVTAVGEFASSLVYFEIQRGPLEWATLIRTVEMIELAIERLAGDAELPRGCDDVLRDIDRCLGRPVEEAS